MRNFYLTAAGELTEGIRPLPMAGGRNADLVATLPLQDWFNAYALRLNPDRARGVQLSVIIRAGSQGVLVTVDRQVEFARPEEPHQMADAVLDLTNHQLEQLTNGSKTLDESLADGASLTGDKSVMAAYLALHDSFDMWFPIVTP